MCVRGVCVCVVCVRACVRGGPYQPRGAAGRQLAQRQAKAEMGVGPIPKEPGATACGMCSGGWRHSVAAAAATLRTRVCKPAIMRAAQVKFMAVAFGGKELVLQVGPLARAAGPRTTVLGPDAGPAASP